MALGSYMGVSFTVSDRRYPKLGQRQHHEYVAKKSAKPHIFNCQHFYYDRSAYELAQYMNQLKSPCSLNIACGIL